MSMDQPTNSARSALAKRNRDTILMTARAAFAESGAQVSMAEVARRAGVGMATLYRNFPGRRELLEALFMDEVDAMCAASEVVEGDTPGAKLVAWLRRFAEFIAGKREIGAELLKQTNRDDPVFTDSRTRVLAAGSDLLAAAKASGEVSDEFTLEQLLDMVLALSAIRGDAGYVEPILRAAFDGVVRTRP